MTDSSAPAWLKIMEHGASGEARTKAFLLDRFWVLERSVDIDGADFLVQPRSLKRRFTESAPKLGVVQAKYFQDRGTTHYIPSRYVLDDQRRPFKGFFAVLHVGKEDNAEMFLLTANEIASACAQSTDEAKHFIIGAKALDEKFKVHNRRLSLDKIEHEISIRSERETYSFLDRVHVPYRRISERDIDFEYTLGIPNEVDRVPRAYFAYRQTLKSVQINLEDAVRVIDKVLETTNPREALVALEDLSEFEDPRGGFAFGHRKLESNFGYLKDALDDHDKKAAALRKAGLLEAFLGLSGVVQSKLLEKTENALLERGEYLCAELKYDQSTLAFADLTIRVTDAAPKGKSSSVLGCCFLGSSDKDGGKRSSDCADELWQRLLTKVYLRLKIDPDE